MTTKCNNFYFVNSGDDCNNIAADAGITIANFYSWNPTIGTSCASLWADYYVCIGVTGGQVPAPVQPGIASECGSYHLVVSGDTCNAVASAAGISLSEFSILNPTVGSTCSELWLGYYVCTSS
jgi:LysM repeat protein